MWRPWKARAGEGYSLEAEIWGSHGWGEVGTLGGVAFWGVGSLKAGPACQSVSVSPSPLSESSFPAPRSPRKASSNAGIMPAVSSDGCLHQIPTHNPLRRVPLLPPPQTATARGLSAPGSLWWHPLPRPSGSHSPPVPHGSQCPRPPLLLPLPTGEVAVCAKAISVQIDL